MCHRGGKQKLTLYILSVSYGVYSGPMTMDVIARAPIGSIVSELVVFAITVSSWLLDFPFFKLLVI